MERPTGSHGVFFCGWDFPCEFLQSNLATSVVVSKKNNQNEIPAFVALFEHPDLFGGEKLTTPIKQPPTQQAEYESNFTHVSTSKYDPLAMNYGN